ncbi:MAG: hypothetical protein DBX59_00075 [Bacillota bacterium]|nr:MAG: hypothetical protein DBX59_00075 [Bacillota bacterium]
MKSRVIALSAVAAGFVALFLTLGAYVSFIDIFSVIIASVFVVLPMYLDSLLGSVLAFLAGGVIAFLLGGANIFSLVWPSYLLFFGILPILNFIVAKKNFNKTAWFIIKLVWFLAVCAFLVFYYTAVMHLPVEYVFSIFGKEFDFSHVAGIEIIFYAVFGVLCVVFFLVYNQFVRLSQAYVNRVLARIIKK